MFHPKRDIFIANFVVTNPFVPLYILDLENSTSFVPSPFVPGSRRTRDQQPRLIPTSFFGVTSQLIPPRCSKKQLRGVEDRFAPNCESIRDIFDCRETRFFDRDKEEITRSFGEDTNQHVYAFRMGFRDDWIYHPYIELYR